MRGTRSLAVVLILSMVSACAGEVRPQIERRLSERQPEAPDSYSEVVEARTPEATHQDAGLSRDAVPAAHHGGEREDHDRPHHHVHDEPGPEEKAAAEVALILTGSIFLCTFVVVVLDGACEFGAYTGYYY